MNFHNKAIGLGSFFKCRPYDYTNDELNLPQGHEDRIRMVDLLPANRKRCEDENDGSVRPTDWLEHTAEAHPALDQSYGPGTWKRLMMGDRVTQYGSFYTGPTREFSNIHGQKNWDHQLETKEKVKALQVRTLNTTSLQTLESISSKKSVLRNSKPMIATSWQDSKPSPVAGPTRTIGIGHSAYRIEH